MLTLTRRVGEKIRIGDDIVVEVREVRGKQVRIGIIAPATQPVYREELYLECTTDKMIEMIDKAGAKK